MYSTGTYTCTCTCMYFIILEQWCGNICTCSKPTANILAYFHHSCPAFIYFVYSSVSIYWTFIWQCPAWLAVSTPLFLWLAFFMTCRANPIIVCQSWLLKAEHHKAVVGILSSLCIWFSNKMHNLLVKFCFVQIHVFLLDTFKNYFKHCSL